MSHEHLFLVRGIGILHPAIQPSFANSGDRIGEQPVYEILPPPGRPVPGPPGVQPITRNHQVRKALRQGRDPIPIGFASPVDHHLRDASGAASRDNALEFVPKARVLKVAMRVVVGVHAVVR